MTSLRWPAALAALLLGASAVHAQLYIGPPPAFSYSRGGFSYKRVKGRTALSVGFGFGVLRGGYYAAPIYPYFDAPPISRVTVINIVQPPPPIVVLQQPPPLLIPEGLPPDIIPRNVLPEMPRVPEVPPVPGFDPKGKDREKEKDKPKKDEAKPKPRPERELPGRPGPEADPRDEHARLVRAGRELFREMEYGRAAHRFRQAVRLDPAEALPYFLLAQSLLSQGSYHEAYDAITAGMRRKLDWPTTRFRAQDLYGQNLGEYADLLRALERTHAKHRGDPVILFLRGYVLWFDGRKEEAAPLFRQALKGADDRGPIERFLAALPDVEL